MMTIKRLLKGGFCWILATPLATQALPRYGAIKLVPESAYSSWGSAINASGQVSGWFAADSSGNVIEHAFITGTNGSAINDIGSLGGISSYSWAEGVNAAGQVVGHSQTSGNQDHAFLYSNGTMTDLGTLTGSGTSWAWGINDNGQVVGMSDIGAGNEHAFLTGPNGAGMTDLGTLGGPSSVAYGINTSGQVVGWSQLSGESYGHAFITGPNGVGMNDVGALGGGDSTANGINANGQVVGFSYINGGAYQHAFITGSNGMRITDLGTLGGSESFGYGINASGQVVGGSYISGDSNQHAFVTGANGMAMTDLNSLLTASLTDGGYLYEALGVSDSGQIVAEGSDNYAYLLTPVIGSVPIPATKWLLFSGLLCMCTAVRRKVSSNILFSNESILADC